MCRIKRTFQFIFAQVVGYIGHETQPLCVPCRTFRVKLRKLELGYFDHGNLEHVLTRVHCLPRYIYIFVFKHSYPDCVCFLTSQNHLKCELNPHFGWVLTWKKKVLDTSSDILEFSDQLTFTIQDFTFSICFQYLLHCDLCSRVNKIKKCYVECDILRIRPCVTNLRYYPECLKTD